MLKDLKNIKDEKRRLGQDIVFRHLKTEKKLRKRLFNAKWYISPLKYSLC